MTNYELIQQLAKCPPNAVVRYGFDWSDDVVVDPSWADGNFLSSDGSQGIPTVVLSCAASTAHLRETPVVDSQTLEPEPERV